MPENDDNEMQWETTVPFELTLDEPEKTLEYPKNSQEPLDNPNETSDNLTVGESTQLQVTTISHQETKEAFDDAIVIAQQRHYAKWYDSGANAKKKGYSRISPFYERPTADYFFYCGFDGVKFEDTVVNLENSMQSELDNAPKVTDFLP